ncbi:hypothetical protein NP233_g9457 [Leucocoprinus birnbaumii]|uniref:Nephrocystin 3-like N-terminal domain-containing protein n=1 Tax=Leucocoprinus birnbaumii TaxID=56174 RepID=A0AAD5YSU8_9AGAR|nr:hypothetical protein NP233_g9457 [Leucocoprinus birnbaumii]
MIVRVVQQQLQINNSLSQLAVRTQLSKNYVLTIHHNGQVSPCGVSAAVDTRELSSLVAYIPSKAADLIYTESESDVKSRYSIKIYSHVSPAPLNVVDLLTKRCIPGTQPDSPAREFLPRCHPRTREILLRRIVTWATATPSSTPDVLWLSGSAGTGKSAVSQSVSEKLSALGLLGAAVFFSKDYHCPPVGMNPLEIIATISHQFAYSFPGYGRVVGDVLAKDPSVLEKGLSFQFRALLVEPLLTMAIERGPRRDPMVVVLDGLDQYPNQAIQCELLRLVMLHSQLDGLALKWLISSRPEWYLESTFFSPQQDAPFIHEDLHHLGREDIKNYIKARLQQVSRLYPDLLEDGFAGDSTWPTAEDTHTLFRAAGDVFTIAVSVLDYIQGPDSNTPCEPPLRSHPRDRLQDLLVYFEDPSPPGPLYNHSFKEIHTLYASSLSHLISYTPQLSGDSVSSKNSARPAVSHSLIQVFKLWTTEPTLNPFEICNLLSLSRRQLYHALRSIQGLVRCSHAFKDKYNRRFLRGIHPAFLDFITNPPNDLNPHFSDASENASSTISHSLLRPLLRPRLLLSINGLSWKSQPPYGFSPQALAIEDLTVSHKIAVTAIKLCWGFCSSISLQTTTRKELLWWYDYFSFTFDFSQAFSPSSGFGSGRIPVERFTEFLKWLFELQAQIASIREPERFHTLIRTTSVHNPTDEELIDKCKDIAEPLAFENTSNSDPMAPIEQTVQYALLGLSTKTVLLLLTPECPTIYSILDLEHL